MKEYQKQLIIMSSKFKMCHGFRDIPELNFNL